MSLRTSKHKMASIYLLPTTGPKILHLPNEIFYCILGQLPHVSQLCLALTCKQLKELLPPQHSWCLTSQVKAELLSILERDLPQCLQCTCCTKLYLWRDRNVLHTRALLCPNRTAADHDKPELLHSGIYIYQEERDLIVKAHCFGPAYGLPLQVLNWDRSTKIPTSVSSTGTAAIIGENLILRRCESLGIWFEMDIYAQVQVLNYIHNNHVENEMIADHALCVIHALISRAADSCHIEEGTVTVTPLLHCYKCYTAIRVSARWFGDHIEVSVLLYRDLGGRGPSDVTFEPVNAALVQAIAIEDTETGARRNLEHMWREQHKVELQGRSDLKDQILRSAENGSRKLDIVELVRKYGYNQIQSWMGWGISRNTERRVNAHMTAKQSDNRVERLGPGLTSEELSKFIERRYIRSDIHLLNCLPVLCNSAVDQRLEDWIVHWNVTVTCHAKRRPWAGKRYRCNPLPPV